MIKKIFKKNCLLKFIIVILPQIAFNMATRVTKYNFLIGKNKFDLI